jgi:Fe-S-cluster containining protein
VTTHDAARYRTLLERLDAWFAEARAKLGGTIPCRAGCFACCLGPFDISVADAELIQQAVARLPADVRAEVVDRARASLGRMRELAPEWREPYDIRELGDARFDQLADELAVEPCPLLGPDGACRIYHDRPLVCRLMGLGMRTRAGRVIENACPIQHEFPAYAALPPRDFDLESLEDEEAAHLAAAAERLFGIPAARDYETTIAAALTTLSGEARC